MKRRTIGIVILAAAAVVVALVLLRNRFAPQRAAPDKIARSGETRGAASKAAAAPAVQPGAPPAVVPARAATPSSEPPASPPPTSPGLASTRIVQLPRKKPMALQVDLDGDGHTEQLAGTQHIPGPEAPEPNHPVASVYAGPAGGKATAEDRRLGRWNGIMLGFWRRPMRVGGGARVAFFQRSFGEDSTPVAAWLAMVEGKPAVGAMRRTPLRLIDVEGPHGQSPGAELVTTLSNELYQDYFHTGTMDVMRWTGRGLESTLPEATFELCALDPGVDRAIAIAGVTRKSPHRLLLLEWKGSRKRYAAQQAIPVSPPDDGADYHIDQGFALACFPPGRGSTDWQVQYKNRYFAYRDGRLKEVAAPAR